MTDEKILQLSDFEPLVGGTFVLSLEGVEETVEAELVEAVPAKGDRHPDSARDPFTLLFKLPPDKQIAQRLYDVEHSELGKVRIFLVPVQATKDGFYLEAVFA